MQKSEEQKIAECLHKLQESNPAFYGKIEELRRNGDVKFLSEGEFGFTRNGIRELGMLFDNISKGARKSGECDGMDIVNRLGHHDNGDGVDVPFLIWGVSPNISQEQKRKSPKVNSI